MLQQQQAGNLRSQESGSKSQASRFDRPPENDPLQTSVNMLLAGSSPRPTPEQIKKLKQDLEKDPVLKGFTLENLKVQSINGEYVFTAILTKDGQAKAAVAFQKQDQGSLHMYVGLNPGQRTTVFSSDFTNAFKFRFSASNSETALAMQTLKAAPAGQSLAMMSQSSGVALTTDVPRTRSNFDPAKPKILVDGQQRVSPTHPDPSLDEYAVNDHGTLYTPEKIEFSTENNRRVVKVYYQVEGEMREAIFKPDAAREIAEQASGIIKSTQHKGGSGGDQPPRP